MSTIYEKLQQHARKQPERTAVWQRRFDGTYVPTSYAQLAALARRYATAFQAHFPEGQIIPLCLAKTADCIAAMVGALAAGRAFSCLNQKLRPPQIERILTDTKTPIALIDGPGLMALKGGIAADSVIARTRWWLVRGSGFGPTHERLAQQFRAEAPLEDWSAFADESAKLPPPHDDPEGVGCCLFTSGSTGIPKGVMISQKDTVARAEAEVLWFGLTEKDVLLSILPFSFDVGLNQLITVFRAGCELVILDSWLPKDIMKTVEVRKVTGISAVPSIWLDFLNTGLKFDTQGAHASLRYLTVSGGDMSRHHHDKLPAIAQGVGIFKTYGQTEAFRATSLKPSEYAGRCTSVGRAFHGVKVYIVREDGTRADPKETGEVVHTGLGVMMGYLGGNDPQNKLRSNPFAGPDDPAAKAIFTGDQGCVDEEGYLFLTGRRDDMLKIQGNRVYPGEVRDQLLTTPGVGLAEVIGVKHEDQTRLAAFVVAAGGAALDDKAIRAHMTAHAPSYMVPELVVVKRELPRTASGKPDRPLLAAEAKEILFGAAAK